MKLKYVLTIAIAALVSCSPDDGQDIAPAVELKLMSFNIRYSNTEDQGDHAWEARKQPCIAMLEDTEPDIVGFQEPRSDQIAYLAGNLPGYEQINVNVNEGIASAATYNSIMYRKDRFSLLDSGYFWLSDTPDEVSKGWDGAQRRATVWAKFHDKEADSDIFFFCTHMDHAGATARLNGAALNVTKMKELAGRYIPVAIVGDMNASYTATDGRRNQIYPYYEWMYSARETAPDSQKDPLSYNGFDVSLAAATWNIDHIFYRDLTPLKYEVISSPDYGVTYISDHWPIMMTCTY